MSFPFSNILNGKFYSNFPRQMAGGHICLPKPDPAITNFWEGKFVGGQKSTNLLGRNDSEPKPTMKRLCIFPSFFEKKTVESGNSSYLCWSERCYLDDELDLLNSCTFRSHNMHPQFPCTEGCFQGCVPVVQQQPRENAIIIVKLWVHSGQKKMANRGKPKAKNGYLKTKHDKMGYTQGYFFLS